MPLFLHIRRDELFTDDACLFLAYIWTKKKCWKNIQYDEGRSFFFAKCESRFTSIGTNHGIKQDSWVLKAISGIKGIENSSQNLDEYFLSATEIGIYITTFCHRYRISEHQTCKRLINFLDRRTKEFEINFVK